MEDALKDLSPPIDGKRRARRSPSKLRDSAATREEILTAASHEIAERGLHAARVEEIAARTATSKHMIYYYFGSKDGLYAAVLEKAYTDFRKAEAAVDYDALDPLQALATLAATTFDSHVCNPQVIRIIMSENLDNGGHIDGIADTTQRGLIIETNRAILQRGIDAGVFRKDVDALQLHLTLCGLCFHFVSNRFTFASLFKVDMTASEAIARRRAEVVETILSRCRA